MKLILSIGTAIAALVALSVFAFAAGPFTSTVQITNNVDSGHNGYWAFENFSRTTTITDNGGGNYTAVLQDSGTFTTIDGAKSPRQGLPLSGGDQGTFTGTYTLTVQSATGPTAANVASTYDYQCDTAANCPGKPASTSDWPKLYFGAAAVVTGGAYDWTYTTKNCDGSVNEQWVDASTNNDGQDAAAGDITGKPSTVTCPTPTPTPTISPSCHPLTDAGNCYEPGEFCRDSDHGVTGVAGDGKAIVCENNDGWRWEPVSSTSESSAPTTPGLPDTGHI